MANKDKVSQFKLSERHKQVLKDAYLHPYEKY